jgi:hypothetical protein
MTPTTPTTPHTKPLLLLRDARTKGDKAALQEMVRTAKRLVHAHEQWKQAVAQARAALDEVEGRDLFIPDDMPGLLAAQQVECQDAEDNALVTVVVVPEKCLQCGAPRQAWQERQETACMVCGGTIGAEVPRG